jgi:hypothetical protein
MHSSIADSEPSAAFHARVDSVGTTIGPALAALHVLSGELMELVGPMFWAALVVLSIEARLLAG